MFIDPPPDSPEGAALQKGNLEQLGFVMNVSRLWGWRPDVWHPFVRSRMQLMEQSTLSEREFAVLVCAAAAALGDSYCALVWGKKLAGASDAPTAAALLRNAPAANLGERERALAHWARKVVNTPNATTARDVARLRRAGLTEREIFEATAFVALRLAFSTINDALGVQPDWQVADAAPAEIRAAVTFGRPAMAAPA